MYARYLNAPLLLLLWQAAPVDLKTDGEGRVRIAIGSGSGTFSFRDYPGSPSGVGCLGPYPAKPPRTESDAYASWSVAAEAWPSRSVRIHAASGHIRDASGERSGTFGGGQAVLEEKWFGVGLGAAVFPRGEVDPSGSVRLGRLDGLSVRADYRYPAVGMGLVGETRVGIGLNQGRTRKPRVFLGMATTPIPDSVRRRGGFLEIAMPVAFKGRIGVSANGFLGDRYHGYEAKTRYSIGLGAWIEP
jgi:hypothetical protein